MIGLTITFGLVCYVLLARFVTKLILNKTKSLLYKRLAIAFFILLPTWDVIIGFPIYWYLCEFHSGVKIYKSVDNVQGFYVGEKLSKWSPLIPMEGYQYVDYKQKYSNQYFRNKWLDNNTDSSCRKPTGQFILREYKKAFENGKCIAVVPLESENLTKYEVQRPDKRYTQILPIIKIEKIVARKIIDRESKNELSKVIYFRWNQGWVHSTFLAVSGSPWTSCSEKGGVENMISKTLKNKR